MIGFNEGEATQDFWARETAARGVPIGLSGEGRDWGVGTMPWLSARAAA